MKYYIIQYNNLGCELDRQEVEAKDGEILSEKLIEVIRKIGTVSGGDEFVIEEIE